MQFIKDLEFIQKWHKEFLAIDCHDSQKLSAAHANLAESIGYLKEDIRRHAEEGSGPRRKEWHAIIRELSRLSKSVGYTMRHPADSARSRGVDSEYSSIKVKIQAME